jgi:hypothetical protein
MQRLAYADQFGKTMRRYFRPQKFVAFAALRYLWAEKPARSCTIDGIVFTPSLLPYRLGIDYKMYKWKQDIDNTADLLLKEDNRLYCRSKRCGLECIGSVRNSNVTELRENIVYECRAVASRRYEWDVVKARHDKPHPNLDWVVENVLNSIKSAISVEELIAISIQTPPSENRHTAQ